jgi:hypothetical protein
MRHAPLFFSVERRNYDRESENSVGLIGGSDWTAGLPTHSRRTHHETTAR